MIERPRGTRDFPPEENEFRFIAEMSLRIVMNVFNYREIRTPTFERLELFTRRSGADIVKQLYDFKDKGDREFALRPELTAAAMRYYFSELRSRPKPLKIFYMGNCFRYERPQEGRYREFWQFGAELIGAPGSLGNAELIGMADKCLLAMGLQEYIMRIGDLRPMNRVMDHLGLSREVRSYLKPMIDKGDLEGVRDKLGEEKIDAESTDLLMSMVSTKMPLGSFRSYAGEFKERFSAVEGVGDAIDELLTTCSYLEMMEVENIVIDLGIARGLDYYVSSVFEVDVEALGAQKQVCGGGQYSLTSVFNEKDDVAACGFAIGFDRALLALEKQGMEHPEANVDVYFIPMGERALKVAIPIINELRADGISVDMDLQMRGMSKNLKYGNHLGPLFIVFLGDDELNKGIATLKDSDTREQEEVPLDELPDRLRVVCAARDEDEFVEDGDGKL